MLEIKFSDLENKFGIKPKPLEAFKYSYESEEGIIDLNQILHHKKKDLATVKKIHKSTLDYISKENFVFSKQIPKVEIFYGRRKELDELHSAIKSETNFIVVLGIAGIGKTTLISKFIKEIKEKTNAFWYQFEVWSSIKHLIKSLGEFLKQLGKKNLSLYLESSPALDIGDVMDILNKDLDGINATLIFDDFQKADKHTIEFFSSFKDFCERIQAPKIIIISRSKLGFYDQRDISIKKSIKEIRLFGLDQENSRKLINLTNISDDQFKTIYGILNGHPVALKLIDSFENLNYQNDFFTFITEQVFNELNNNEKELLKSACVYRYPVDTDALFCNNNVDYNTLDYLEQKFLLIKTRFQTYHMHDLLIDLYYRRLTPNQLISYHNSAAEYYHNKNTDIEVMEQVYHLIKAQKHEIAAELAIEYGDRLISNGYLEFFDLLDTINKNNLPLELNNEIRALKGDALIRIGEWSKALQHYQAELELLELTDEKENLAQVYNRMGDIYSHMGDLEETIKCNLESLKMFQEKDNKKETAKIYNDLGINYKQKGDFKTALDMYQKSYDLFQKINENIGSSLICFNIGKIHEFMDKERKTLASYNKGIKISEECNYDPGIASGYKLIGQYYHSKKKFNQAQKSLEKSLEYFEKGRYRKGIIQVYTQLGEIFIQNNDFDTGIEMYKKGIENLENKISQKKSPRDLQIQLKVRNDLASNNSLIDNKNDTDKNDDQKKIGILYERVGNIYRKISKFNDALTFHTKSLESAINISDDLYIATAYLNIGIDHRKLKSFDQALIYYYEAMKKLNALNNKIGVLTVLRNIGKIYEQKKDLKNALVNYNKSLDLAKEVQYDRGTANAYKEIAKIYIKHGDKRKGNRYMKKAWRLMENIIDTKIKNKNKKQ